MPLYEFRCENCGIFDLWRSMSEFFAPAYCSTCEAPAKQIFSPPAVLPGSLRLKHENTESQVIKRDSKPALPRARCHAGRPWTGH